MRLSHSLGPPLTLRFKSHVARLHAFKLFKASFVADGSKRFVRRNRTRHPVINGARCMLNAAAVRKNNLRIGARTSRPRRAQQMFDGATSATHFVSFIRRLSGSGYHYR